MSQIKEILRIIAAVYAVLCSTMNGWLNNFYGSATRSIAAGFVSGLIFVGLFAVLMEVEGELAYSLVLRWRSELFIALIVAITVLDLAFVSSGKTEKWASEALERYGFLRRHKNKMLTVLIVFALGLIVWSAQPG